VDAVAVVATPHDQYGERPLAVVVLREGATADEANLREHPAASFEEWWFPDEFVFFDEFPRTAINKMQLAEDYADIDVEVQSQHPT
jgi:fatty-acyl-CoA synthase